MSFLPHLPAYRVEEAAADPGAVVMLPVASIEQHGPHLPVYTDTIIGEALVRRLEEVSSDGPPLWTLPALPYGKSNEHVHFPGTVTLTAETLLRVLDEISASLCRSGFSRLALLNSHGGNISLLGVAARDIRVRHGLMVGVFNPLAAVDARSLQPDLSETEARHGIHAGEVETSVMLALRPDLVDLGSADGESRPPQPFSDGSYLSLAGPNGVAWLADDLADDGTLGDPSGASAEAGERYLEEAARIGGEALREFSRLRFREEFREEGAERVPGR